MDSWRRPCVPGLLKTPLETLWGLPILPLLLETPSTRLRMQSPVQRCVKENENRHQGEGLKVEYTANERRKPERWPQGS